VRFCDEIAGTGELCVIERGDRSVVDVFPGIPIDNPLSLNVVDICPVGALIDKNFLFQARVWFAQETATVCPSCSRGCNAKATALDNEVKRLVSRPNPDVNKFWMCDEGRLNLGFINGPKRLKSGRGTARELGAAARTVVQKHGAGSVAGLVSTAQSVEELHLFKKAMTALQATTVGVLTKSAGERRTFKGGFTIEADKTPNRAAAGILLGGIEGIDAVAAGIREGRIKGLIAVNGIPDFAWPSELVELLAKLEFLGVIDIETGPVARAAHVLVPGAVWAEKDGTFVNVDRRVQRIRRAVHPPPAARAETESLQHLLIELGAGERVLSPEGIFKEVARTHAAFAGLDYAKIGPQGCALAAAAEPAGVAT
jgi:NADH-quinone oxidoreductase subunit G